LIIDRAVIENFGSFRGRNELELSPDGKKNITLIVGHGGAGKSTVGQAIRWALYNRKFSEVGESENDEVYSKEDVFKQFFREGGGAMKEGPPAENHISVQLVVTPSESVKKALEAHRYKFGEYALEREASVGKIVSKPGDVILPPLSLKGPDQRSILYPEGFIEEYFLPASMSSFFMFHGDRIKDLTRHIEGSPVTDDIKKVLDVQAMENAANDLQQIMTRFSRNVTTASKDDTRRKELDLEITKIEGQITKLQGQIGEKESLLKEKTERITELEREHRDLLDVAGKLGEYDEKVRAMKGLEGDRDKIEEKKRALLDVFPREALYHTLYSRALKVKEIHRKNEQHRQNAEDVRRQLSQVEKLKPGQKCSVCGQPFPEEMVDQRKKQIEHLNEEIAKEERAIVPLKPEFQMLMRTVIGFENIKYDPKGLQEELYEKRSQVANLDHDITELGKKLGDYTKPAVRDRADEVTVEMNRLSTEQGGLKKEIAGYKKAIDQYTDVQKERSRELAKLGDQASRKAKERFDLADKLHDVFADTVDELAFEKRDEIAKKTGKILMELTIKPELFHREAPVEVDEEFQVRAINKDGNVLEWDRQSSSEKTILSLSFIYGLLSASEKDAPIVLDTFFGKLDPNHIDKFLERLPSFGPQIILITTLEEFSALLDRKSSPFWKYVARYIFLFNDESTGNATRINTISSLDQSVKELEIQVQAKRKESVKR